MWAGFKGELEPHRTVNTGIVEVGFVGVHQDAIQALTWSPKSPLYVSPSQILNGKTQSYAPDLPLASWELLGKVWGKIQTPFSLRASPCIKGLLPASAPAPWSPCHFLTTSDVFQSQGFCTCCPPPTPEISSFRTLHGWCLTSFRFVHLSRAIGLSWESSLKYCLCVIICKARIITLPSYP